VDGTGHLRSNGARPESGKTLLPELPVREYGTFETDLPPRFQKNKLFAATLGLTLLGTFVYLVLGGIVGIVIGAVFRAPSMRYRIQLPRFAGALPPAKPSPSCSRSAFFDMSSVQYPSNYSHPPSYTTRTLVPGGGHPEESSWRFTTVNISGKVTGNFKYVGGVLTASCKVVFVPCDADVVGIFDPATSAFSVVDISAKVRGRNKYFGGVLAPSGKVVFVPWHAAQVGIFDPSTHAFSVVDISAAATGAKYVGGVLAPNGRIVFVPWDVNNVGIFDPAISAFSLIDISATITGVAKYRGGVLAPNGRVVFVPSDAAHVYPFPHSLPQFACLEKKTSGFATES